jgi:hypothetical protein
MLDFLSRFPLDALQYGALGFGMVLLVLVFIILLQNKPPADDGIRYLRKWFLGAGVFCFVLALVAPLFESRIAPSESRYEMTLTFSPDLVSNGLPEPSMLLFPQDVGVEQDRTFTVDRNTTIRVRVDDIIRHASNQRDAIVNLLGASEELTQRLEGAQREISALRRAEGPSSGAVSPGAPTAPALLSERSLRDAHAAQREAEQGVLQGDTTQTLRASKRLWELSIGGEGPR